MDFTNKIPVFAAHFLLLPLGVGIVIKLNILLVLCVTFVFSCHWPWGLHFLKGECRVFKVHNNLSGCFACKGETDIDEYAQALTQEK